MSDVTREVGIIISAKDKASKMLEVLGRSGKQSLDAIGKAANAASGAMSTIGKAGIAINQGLEIAKKAFNIFKMAVFDTIEVAKKFRAENDPAIKQMESLGNQANIVRARLGDALIPVLQGFSQALTPILNKIEKWIVQNRELIGTKLLEWAYKVGNILITVVATGALYVSRAWSGWLEIINVVKIAVNEFFELFLKGNAELLGVAADLARTFDDDLANSIEGISKGAQDFGEEFSKSSDEAQKKLIELVNEQNEFEKQIEKFGITAKEVLEKAIAIGYQKVKTATVGARTETKELTEEENKLNKAMEEVSKKGSSISSAYKDVAKNTQESMDAQQVALEQQKKNMQELKDITMDAATSMAASVGSGFGAMIMGAGDAGEIMRREIVSIAETAVMAYAASGAAATAFSQAGIPVIGPLLAITASGMIFGIIKAYMAQIPKAASGGFVSSGMPGIDMVPVLTQKGEGILTPGQTKAIQGMANSITKNKRQDPGGSIVINYERRSTVPERSAQTNREVKELGRIVKRLQKRKMW